MRLNNGLVGFTRKRIGMRKARDRAPAGRLTKASIHHAGPVGRPPRTFARARAMWLSFQDFHMDNKGWDDIGYNLGVDGLGRLYQGRPVGTLPAAVGEHNSNMIGIVFMQDGRFHRLNPLQRRTLRILFEKGVPAWKVPPLKNLTVRAHKEYDGHEGNECPGRYILRHLRWRRSQYR